MTERGWDTATIEGIPRLGKTWVPVRKHFDIRAFGINAWIAEADGDDVIGEHTEDSGHEELYFVSAGRASFTVDGKEVDDLACMEALLGHPENAIEHLRPALEEPRFKEAASTDSDLDSIRDDPGFPK